VIEKADKEEPTPKNGTIKNSTRKGKKAMVFMDGKWHHFGDAKMKHNYSKEAREAATARHAKNLKGSDSRSKAFRRYWDKYWTKGGDVKKTDTRTEKAIQTIIKGLEAGLIDYDNISKAHKYIRREGTKGNYRYIYEDDGGSRYKSRYEFPRDTMVKDIVPEKYIGSDFERNTLMRGLEKEFKESNEIYSQENVDKFFEKIDPEKINVSNLTIVQDRLNERLLDKKIREKGKSPIRLFKVKDRLFVADGNHRAVASIKRGEKEINAKVVDLTENVKDEDFEWHFRDRKKREAIKEFQKTLKKSIHENIFESQSYDKIEKSEYPEEKHYPGETFEEYTEHEAKETKEDEKREHGKGGYEEVPARSKEEFERKEHLGEMIKEHERLIEVLQPHAEMDEKVKKEIEIQQRELDEYQNELNELNELARQEYKRKTDTNPTEAQRKSGNYKKGRRKVYGLDIAIEHPKGSLRTGKDRYGNEWQSYMNNDYGYFNRTKGKDGDQIDVFLSDEPEQGNIYIIDQQKDGKFDEHKVMVGFSSESDALESYKANYERGAVNYLAINKVTPDELKSWLNVEKKNKRIKRKPYYELRRVNKSEDYVLGPKIMF